MPSPARTCSPEQVNRIFWATILPFQTVFLTAFLAPVYGFNALVRPINEVFSPDNVNNDWSAALIIGVILLSVGIGGLFHPQMLKLAGGRNRLFIIMNALFVISFGIGALACHLKLYWLMLAGFAIPAGIACTNLFFIAVVFLVSWGYTVGKVGLTSGVFGMLFGVWAAFYSIVAPILETEMGIVRLLILTGIVVATIELLALIFMINPPETSTSEETPEHNYKIPLLSYRKIIRIPSFWLFAFFFLLFLTPGFGFKVIVSALSNEIFHTTQFVSSMMAAAFLISYGTSRLVFGIVADKLKTKPMYFMFSGIQAVALLLAAITLPYMKGVIFFTILMCITGAMFAAGKSLWSITVVRMYGPRNFRTPMMMTQPFYGAAGFLGPLSLTWALRSEDVVVSTSWWLYGASGALLLCVILFHMLRRVNYDKLMRHESQGAELTLKAQSEFDRF